MHLEITKEKFRHKTPIQLRFKDLDSLGHVNNANYLTYVETARIYYTQDVLKDLVDWREQGIILARAEIDFLKPVLLEDQIVVYTKCNRIGNKSFDLIYKIVRVNGDSEEIMAAVKTIMVCLNYKTNKTFQVPDSWKQAIENFELER